MRLVVKLIGKLPMGGDKFSDLKVVVCCCDATPLPPHKSLANNRRLDDNQYEISLNGVPSHSNF